MIFGLRTEAARARRLGQYTLEHKIGAGGRPRSSCFLLTGPVTRPSNGSSAKVQMTAELSHLNTVAIYDYGRTPDGVCYYAMEYLDGINLEDLVRRHGPQPAGRVMAILDQSCGALGEAHERGLVHRDIKPATERPQSARALRDVLSRCWLVPPWTSDDAVACWQTFRSNGPPRDLPVPLRMPSPSVWT